MSQKYSVDTEALSTGRRKILNGVDTLREEMNGLDRHMDTMLVNWTGKASEGFRDLHKDWEREQGQLRDVLDDIAELLRTAIDNYEGSESSNRNMLSGNRAV